MNKKGQFNVPYGEYSRRYFDVENLRAVSDALARVEIRAGDFETSLDGIGKADFAYMDPPYWKLGGYSDFDRYTEYKFKANDHIRLASVCREMNSRGVRWAVSNSDTSFIRELYEGFKIGTIHSRREINLKANNRNTTELIITNY